MTEWQIKSSSGLTPEGEPGPCLEKPIPVVGRTLVPTVSDADVPVTRGQLASLLSKLLPTRRQKSPIVETRRTYLQARAKIITVGGGQFQVDADMLMRMIRQLTQQIGEYKDMDNIYSRYVIPSLRKARSDMVSDLERHFSIKWELDKQGQSVFYT